LKKILENIRIIPVKSTLRSEEVIQRQTKRLANYMEHDGMQRDPIIVAREGDQYIALDGMHRVEALKMSGCRDLVAYLVEYSDERILLESWDCLVSGLPDVQKILTDEFSGEEYRIADVEGEDGREEVMSRRSIFSVVGRDGRTCSITRRARERELALDELIDALVRFEKRLDEAGARIRYVANTASESQFRESKCDFLVIRPCFTKKEVRQRTLGGKLFPRKTTRHSIYERPLRVGVALSILRQAADIEVKNELLQAELKWRQERGRIRYYPEPVILFDD